MRNRYDSPALRGEDNEYGDYDYLAGSLPSNVARWDLSRTTWKCDACKHYRHLRFITRYHFYTVDGYDSSDYDVCWVCMLRSAIKIKVSQLKKNTQAFWFALRIAIKTDPGWKAGMFRAAYNIMRGK